MVNLGKNAPWSSATAAEYDLRTHADGLVVMTEGTAEHGKAGRGADRVRITHG